MHLVHQLSRHLKSGALEELTLTTNGSQLSRFAAELADCGVRRINVSMDTLDADKFHQITRWGHLGKVMISTSTSLERIAFATARQAPPRSRSSRAGAGR